MTKNERYVEMHRCTENCDHIEYNEHCDSGEWSFTFGAPFDDETAYAIIEADIRKQLIAAGWSLTWVADNPGQTTFYTIDKMTLTGAQHYNEFSDYAAALLYGITIERELYGVKEGA